MDDTEARNWAQKVVDFSRRGIEESENFCSIVTEGYLSDPLCATQLGMAIMSDKPIILMVKVGTKIPKHFEKIASGIIYFQDQNDFPKAAKRMEAILKKIESERDK